MTGQPHLDNEWTPMDTDNSAAVAMAYNEGWFEAFKQAQEVLADLTKTIDPHSNQRFVLNMASELLHHRAAGKKATL